MFCGEISQHWTIHEAHGSLRRNRDECTQSASVLVVIFDIVQVGTRPVYVVTDILQFLKCSRRLFLYDILTIVQDKYSNHLH